MEATSQRRVTEGTGLSSYLRISVFLAGACTMATEMIAPRLLAPSFGATQIVWTSVIGIVLMALTSGAWVGGRLADRFPTPRAYAAVLTSAGLLVALIPLLSPNVLEWGAHALGGLHLPLAVSSLFAATALFAPGVFFLGMIAPWAVRLIAPASERLGAATGEVWALGAFGSIVGTFGATFALLPLLGASTSLLVLAALLVALGLPALSWRLARVGALAVLGATVLGTGLDARGGRGVVWERESPYQRVAVRRDGRGATRLVTNAGLGAQSLWPASGIVTGGVWDYVSLLPSLVTEPGGELRVLILGLAGGTMARQIDAAYAERNRIAIDGVEVDPVVLEAARQHLGLGSVASLRAIVGDGRVVLERLEGGYELIVVDAFRGGYAPFHLATREFFESCRSKLSPRGAVAMNLALPSASAELLDTLGATLGRVFPHVFRLEIPSGSVFFNVLFVASMHPLSPPAPDQAPPLLDRAARSAVWRSWRRVAPAPSATRIFTDDWAPIEVMMDAAIFDLAMGRKR